MKTKLYKLCLGVFTALSLSAFSQTITTVGGIGTGGYSGDGGSALSAQLNDPFNLTTDAAGNVYIVEESNHVVRKITPGGIISTVAGTGAGGYSGDGGAATSAQLNIPTGIVIDPSGNIYIADLLNNRVRKITPGGIISTLAGTGSASFSGDGGPAASAALNYPEGVALDNTGTNLYIADRGNNRIRVVSLTAFTITTFAGTGASGSGGDGGPALAAQFSLPLGVGTDPNGNVYVADYGNNKIRKINTSGIITLLAGTGTAGFSGDGGLGSSAQLSSPTHAFGDASGNVYISDYNNHRLRKVNSSSIISTYAGTGLGGFSGDGGLASAAQINGSTGACMDGAGNIFLADRFNDRIRKISGTCPTVSLSLASNSIACNGSTTSATATANGGTGFTYTWSPSGGSTSVVTVPAGNYTVTASNSCSNTVSQTILITQPAPLFINATASPTSICQGNSSSLISNGGGGTGALTYSWSSGAGTNTTTVSPGTTTVYSITITDANNCSKTETVSVTVNANPTVSAVTSNSMLCSNFNQSATLTANGALSYTWSTSANGQNIVVTPSTTTSYTVTGTDSNGCTGSTVFTQSTTVCGGISETVNVSSVNVYPNPNSGEFTLSVKSNDVNVEIYNSLGQVIRKEKLMEGNNRFDIKNFANGVYVLKVYENGKVTGHSKLIKE